MGNDIIRILCVEDEAHDRELIRDALEKESEGFEMTEAGDREAFESLLSEGDFDVVLTDFNILGFEGLDVIQSVRAGRPETPVIVVTGTGSEEIAVRALREGAEDYVIKTPGHIAQLPMTVRRILEAKRTRDKLRERDENFRALVANTADGILVVDHGGKILFSNPAAVDLLGQRSEELIGQVFGHPIGNRDSLEIDLPRKRGGAGTAAMRVAQTVWNGETAFIVSLRDITERNQAEKALKESETKYRQLIDTLNEGIWRIDATGHTTFVNPKMAEMLGYTEEEMNGAHFFQFMDDEWVKDAKTKLERRQQGITEQHEFTFRKKSGKPLYMLLNTSPILDAEGNFDGALASVTDISERKKAEKQLTESKNLLRQIIDTAPCCIFAKDREGHYLLVNKYMADLYRTEPQKMIGKTDRDFSIDKITTGEEADRFLEDDRCVIDTGQAKSILEEPFSMPDGEIKRFQTYKIPFTFAGDPNCVLGVAIDITEQVKTREERSRLEAQLRHAQRMEAISTLAGGIAHDFNNILSAVMGYAQLAQMKLDPGSEPYEDLKEVVRSANRARLLIGQILAVGRSQEQERQPMQLKYAAKEALRLLRSTLPSFIEIREAYDKDLGTIHADPTQMHQVIMNLCTNAGHAMQEHGGILELDLRNVAFAVRDEALTLSPGGYLKMTVKDTGCGMSPDITGKIFEPYFTTKQKGVGTGLGLSVVHGIVSQHGGVIAVESELGKGSKFHVYLPITHAQEERPAVEEEAPLPKGNERILFVDDEAALAAMGKKMLRGLGYDVTSMTDSMEALALFKQDPQRFDLVITDTTMPRMPGDMLAREMMTVRPDIPIIICTGHSERMSKEKADAMRIKAFLMKPMEMRNLAETVRRALNG